MYWPVIEVICQDCEIVRFIWCEFILVEFDNLYISHFYTNSKSVMQSDLQEFSFEYTVKIS